MVAGFDEEMPAVLRDDDGVVAVLPTALRTGKLLERIEHVVAVRVAQAVKTLAARMHIEAVVRPNETLRSGNGDRNLFHRDIRGVRGIGHRDTKESLASLVGGNEPALLILAQRDPRSLLALRHRVEQLGVKSLGDLESSRCRLSLGRGLDLRGAESGNGNNGEGGKREEIGWSHGGS